MTPRSQVWFKDATKRGVDPITAFIGTELIDGWQQFWEHEISSAQLEKMIEFALLYPAAAMHRWSMVAKPFPWLPDPSTLEHLKRDPRYSVLEDVRKQRFWLKVGRIKRWIISLLKALVLGDRTHRRK